MTSQHNELQGSRAIIAWALVAQLLLQPLLTYWITPRVAQDAHGQWVVMCTLNGTEAVYLDLGGDSEKGSAEQHCPALKLFHLAGSAHTVRPLQLQPAMLYLVGLIDQAPRHRYHPLFTPGYSSRAPPIA